MWEVDVPEPDFVVIEVTSASGAAIECPVKRSTNPREHDYQVDLAFAFTFHKVQGMTLEIVVAELNKRGLWLSTLSLAAL